MFPGILSLVLDPFFQASDGSKHLLVGIDGLYLLPHGAQQRERLALRTHQNLRPHGH